MPTSMTERTAERTARARTVAEDVALWRAKYPDALVCTACGVLLASRRESYHPLADVGAYICAECRRNAAEAERVRAVKVEQARRAGRASAAARQVRAAVTEAGERYETLPVPLPPTLALALSFPPLFMRVREGGFVTLAVVRGSTRRMPPASGHSAPGSPWPRCPHQDATGDRISLAQGLGDLATPSGSTGTWPHDRDEILSVIAMSKAGLHDTRFYDETVEDPARAALLTRWQEELRRLPLLERQRQYYAPCNLGSTTIEA